MLPYKTIIKLERSTPTPLYIQITNEFIKQINCGIIVSGLKLPGSRTLSDALKVNRRTVISAYDELEAQGWIEVRPNQGSFISTKLPIVRKHTLTEESHAPKSVSGFGLGEKFEFLEHLNPPDMRKIDLVIDTGYPDVRLAPLRELTQNFNSALVGNPTKKLMNYASDFAGDVLLRQELVKYLAETRGINTTVSNIALVRGSLMAFFGLFQILLQPGDQVVVGDVSFKVAVDIIKIAGGTPLHVRVDDQGIDVDAIESICKKTKIRAVFVMPHHHHPTTVSLNAERRLKLLTLAEEYKFAIIEDDYDYDFHYASSPILPMASADPMGVVNYVGSFSKTIAPGLRTGFIVAAEDMIRAITRLGRFIDCHGNPALERAMASLFSEGIIKRHLKKSLIAYRERRNYFCSLLETLLGDFVSFKIPDGGLAVWVVFREDIDLAKLREEAEKLRLLIPRTMFYDLDGRNPNALRLGFASLNETECTTALETLRKAVVLVHANR